MATPSRGEGPNTSPYAAPKQTTAYPDVADAPNRVSLTTAHNQTPPDSGDFPYGYEKRGFCNASSHPYANIHAQSRLSEPRDAHNSYTLVRGIYIIREANQ